MQGSREQKRKFLYQEIVSKGYNADDFHQQFLTKTGKQFSLDKWDFEHLKAFVLQYQNSVKSKQIENSKQKNDRYLKEEIINKGYDTSDFNSYLSLNNDNSTNVDEWEFNKLQQFVSQYKQLVQSRKSQQAIKQKQNFLVSEIIDKGFDSEDFHRFFIENNPDSTDINNWEMQQIKVFVLKYQQTVYNKRQQESLQQKRKYLIAEIIDKGYDNEHFQDHLLNNKGKSINIANWEFQQLKQFVAEYQKSVYEKRILQSRQEKQRYLVQQIIDKGYESEDFQEALLHNHQHHVNLDEWELEELKKFVENYQQTYQQRKRQKKRKQKIDYLNQQIIEKRYDPDDFQQYLKDMSWKQGETSIDDWELQQLKKYVSQYQQEMRRKEERIDDLVEKKIKKAKKKKNKEKEKEKEKQDGQSKADKKKQSPSSSPDKDNLKKLDQKVESTDKQFQFNLMTGQESFSQIIQCIQVPPNELLSKDVEIKITKFQKNEGGLFENFYYTYIVQTPCLSKIVQRRYNDFVWLKQTLEYNHPGLPVPPVAKKGTYRRSDQKHLNKRRMILEKFLNEIVQIPVLKADQIFQNFLKINNYVQFEKFKSDYKRTSSVELTKVRNFRGKLNVGIDSEINKFLINSQKFIVQQQPLTKKLFKDYKAVATSLEQTAKTLTGISTLCNDLNQKDQFFRKQSNLKLLPNNTYTMLRQSSLKFAQLLVRQARTLRTEIYSAIKYQNLNLLNYLESFDKLKAYQQEYLQVSNNLYKKKQKIYQQRNMMKWVVPNSNPKTDKSQSMKTMLPNQTREFDKLRIGYGLRNFSMFQQINRHFSKNHQYMAKFLTTYFRIQNEIANEMKQVWWQSQVQASTIHEGKLVKKLS